MPYLRRAACFLCRWTASRAGLGRTFTARLTVNYRAPVPADSVVIVRARVERVERRKIFMAASVHSADGKVLYAEADALFVLIRRTEQPQPP